MSDDSQTPRSPGSDREDGSSTAAARRFPPLERDILDKVCSGDREALGVFFEHYFDRVYGLAYRLLGNHAGAEDAAQEVFTKVFRAAHQLDPQRDPAPWLLKITLNTCRSFWRSTRHRMDRKSMSLDSPEDGAIDVKNGRKGPHDNLEASERERVVQQAVMELPETLRGVVILKDYMNLDHKEIAATLELSHDAVRKRYSRALTELGDLLRGRLE
ncbi:MAG: sigma-70 family RNA polymerase sigma factor [Candidatus Eisenbacteria bacterium]|nr:sigma-70 family RNA polymerase sigma factor [Candidatus Eisenbacteria bacterium]